MKLVLWYLGVAAVVGLIAYAAHYFLGSTAAFIAVIVPLALIANGWLAEWEDNQPGGFNESSTPKDVADSTQKSTKD